MRIVKTFEGFFNGHDDQEMMPHQAPRPDMQQYPAAKIDHDEHHETENYMFFGNLETLKRLIEIMLKMDQSKVDQVLKDGHSWAVDHVATSKDDIEEVANFLIGEMDKHNEGSMDNSVDAEYIAEGKYSCNECGISYEAAVINEGDVCECGGTLTNE